ncbi:hypothetical protein H257_03725 [Aphanomyces astaci]|uniref:Uncharacterized protein n=1 Tax=Aphanomyces astaci TaxID=112090 RepID=W4GY33_APHAT|nr:hypothetical protein H257_03725 [Aphanomyces astaci]ETV84552.1 hypothetical protein H257_03725 [Aphanomyces astaci]|eukprot:XP_009826244.1 hypothetical protein H257_03725 [Aphanomyces astaci]
MTETTSRSKVKPRSASSAHRRHSRSSHSDEDTKSSLSSPTSTTATTTTTSHDIQGHFKQFASKPRNLLYVDYLEQKSDSDFVRTLKSIDEASVCPTLRRGSYLVQAINPATTATTNSCRGPLRDGNPPQPSAGAASAAKTCVPLVRPPIVDVRVCVACADSINQDNPKASSIECTPAAAAVLLPPALVKALSSPASFALPPSPPVSSNYHGHPLPPLIPKSTVRRLPLPQSDTSWSDRGIAAPIADDGSAHGLRVCCGDQVVALAEVQALDEQPCVFVVLNMHERTIGLQTPRVESDPTPRTDLLNVHHDLIMLEFHHTVLKLLLADETTKHHCTPQRRTTL